MIMAKAKQELYWRPWQKTKPLVWPWIRDTVDLLTTKLCWDIIIPYPTAFPYGNAVG